MERINSKSTSRALSILRTSPEELRDIANNLEAAATNGNALPGQVVHYDATAHHRFEWDPEVTFEKFAKGSQSWVRPETISLASTQQN